MSRLCIQYAIQLQCMLWRSSSWLLSLASRRFYGIPTLTICESQKHIFRVFTVYCGEKFRFLSTIRSTVAADRHSFVVPSGRRQTTPCLPRFDRVKFLLIVPCNCRVFKYAFGFIVYGVCVCVFVSARARDNKIPKREPWITRRITIWSAYTLGLLKNYNISKRPMRFLVRFV